MRVFQYTGMVHGVLSPVRMMTNQELRVHFVRSASKLCSGMKEFCCEGPQPKDKSQKINCCCTPDDFMGGLYGCKGRFISPTCSEYPPTFTFGKGILCEGRQGRRG